MTTVTLAATQMACSWDTERNVQTAEALIREAAGKGAQIIVLQELFLTPYFCPDLKESYFSLARPAEGHPVLRRFSALAAELGVVLPVSFFERANNAYYNALAVLDADGRMLGVYRKSHIPDCPGYQEKFYFNPGDTGFRVWRTRYATIGAAICWDQWYPEAARCMVLRGAEVLLYPTAIGSELLDPAISSRDPWMRVMQGHAAANMVPVVASNRVGTEKSEAGDVTFYGSSFITDNRGAFIAQANETDQAVITAAVDLERCRAERASWGLFRDRRPELYGALLTLDGATRGEAVG
ncbi:N-carbamoylputrescine amidase [Sorangium sp. So ce131]|uniref:N-carbamoylputrescine amidase n=1 Tax=Sorangium sp. So ce131 TaxID=3133282 RepID=UPI003F610ECB